MSEESTRAWKDQYMLRLPDGMRDRIKAAAEANNRSMNAEIVAVLQREYPAPEPDAEMREIIDQMLSLPPEDRQQIIGLILHRLRVTE